MSVHYSPKIVTDGLVCLLDAGNSKSYPGSGTSWFDISGNNRHFTWDSADWNSSGFFTMFSAATTRIATGPASNSFGINNTTGYTIFFIFQTTVSGGNAGFKFRGSANRGIFCHPGWVSDTIYFDQGGCCNADHRISYTNSNINESNIWNIVGLRSTVATRAILYNGIVGTTTSTAAANINLDSNPVVINPNDESLIWQGKIAYFAVYNKGISNAEYLNNYNALKNRFGL